VPFVGTQLLHLTSVGELLHYSVEGTKTEIFHEPAYKQTPCPSIPQNQGGLIYIYVIFHIDYTHTHSHTHMYVYPKVLGRGFNAVLGPLMSKTLLLMT
jgi:hypothetical protein